MKNEMMFEMLIHNLKGAEEINKAKAMLDDLLKSTTEENFKVIYSTNKELKNTTLMSDVMLIKLLIYSLKAILDETYDFSVNVSSAIYRASKKSDEETEEAKDG